MPASDGVVIEEVGSADGWDGEVRSLAAAHFLQSSAWAAFKGAYGWRARRYRIGDGDGPAAYACVLSRPLVAGRLSLGYVPRGPLLRREDARCLETALAGLETIARRERFLFLKADPAVWDGDAAGWAQEAFRRRGWRRGDEVQFRNTVTVPLDGDDEAVLGRMKPKTRYNVRLAERRGVQIDAGEDAVAELYSLYRDTAVRDGFIVRPRPYYEALWAGLARAGIGSVMLARHEGRLLAGLVAVAYGRRAWYLHGASSDEMRNLMPTYLLQWQAMRWARRRGCTEYDMWGAPETEDESDPMHGVLRFKLGFGGAFRQGVGAWDFSPMPALHRAYCEVVPRLLALRRDVRFRTQRHE